MLFFGCSMIYRPCLLSVYIFNSFCIQRQLEIAICVVSYFPLILINVKLHLFFFCFVYNGLQVSMHLHQILLL